MKTYEELYDLSYDIWSKVQTNRVCEAVALLINLQLEVVGDLSHPSQAGSPDAQPSKPQN